MHLSLESQAEAHTFGQQVPPPPIHILAGLRVFMTRIAVAIDSEFAGRQVP